MKRPYRMHFTRSELCVLIDGMESIIEELKYDGGLRLAEDYMRMENRLQEKLGTTPRWSFPPVEPVTEGAGQPQEATGRSAS